MADVADPRTLFARVRGLGFVGVPPGAPASRYASLVGGNFVSMLSADDTPFGVRGIIGTVRVNALPDIERAGLLQALNLPSDAGLFEATHFILFLPERILGIEHNQFGPRASRLGQYLLEKCAGLVDDMEFTPILRQDVRDRLREVGEVSIIRMAIRRDNAAFAADLDENLTSGFNAVRRVAGDEDYEILEIGLKRRPYARRGAGLPWAASRIANFLRVGRNRDALDEFSVKARNTRTHGIETFDLLEDKMISQVRVVPSGDRRRSVDSQSMLQSIEGAFRAQRGELLALLSAQRLRE